MGAAGLDSQRWNTRHRNAHQPAPTPGHGRARGGLTWSSGGQLRAARCSVRRVRRGRMMSWKEGRVPQAVTQRCTRARHTARQDSLQG